METAMEGRGIHIQATNGGEKNAQVLVYKTSKRIELEGLSRSGFKG